MNRIILKLIVFIVVGLPLVIFSEIHPFGKSIIYLLAGIGTSEIIDLVIPSSSDSTPKVNDNE